MEGPTPPAELPPPPQVERCYRHHDRETLVHCTRCGRPICPSCMIPAPVGHHCPECVADARREFRRGAGRRVAMGSFSITQIMIGVLAAAFLVEIVASGSAQLIFGPTPRQMIRVGATDPILIAIRGQYWRFFTSMFLHYGVFHLAVNCYALWILGSAVETDYGKVRWLIFFVLTGIAGGVSSYAFGPVAGAGAGASGAIFGLMGAFLAYSYRRRATQIGRMRIQAVVQTLILNLVITVALSFIDWRAHLGGFVVGVAAGALLDPGPRELPRAAQVAGMLLLVVGIAGVAAWRTTELRAAFGL